MLGMDIIELPTEIISTETEKSTLIESEKSSKKEFSLQKAGATREVAYKAMVEALGAESMSLDKFGDEHMSPDHGARLRAAEMISKLHGDMKEVVVDNRTYNTMIQASPEEMGVFIEMVKDVQGQLERLTRSGHQTGEVVVDAEVVDG